VSHRAFASQFLVLLSLGGLFPGAVWAADGPATTPTPPRVEVVDVDRTRPSPLPEDGSRVLRIERVTILGREQVSLRQIRGILARENLVAGAEITWPEDPRVTRARDNLRSTGYFKGVVLRLEPIEGSNAKVELVVDLAERSTASIGTLYLGSSELTPFHGGVSVTERNFLGRGVHVGGALVWGTLPNLDRAARQQAYKVFAEAPRIRGTRLGMLGGAYFVSASEPYRVSGEPDDPDPAGFRPLDYSRVGGVLGLTFPVIPDLTFGVDYRFERVDVRASPNLPGDTYLHNGVHPLTSAHFSIVWDQRRELFLAGKGARIALDLQLSSPALGSRYEYITFVVAGVYSFRLPWRHWLTPQLSGGQIAGRAPLFELFYAGDLSDWTPGREQGLRYSTRNPIDVFGTGIDERPFGVLFGRIDLEYAWPLFRYARTRALYGGDLFISAGIFTLAEDSETRKQRRENGERVAPIGFNADLGIRLDTALGTVILSIGNILRRAPL